MKYNIENDEFNKLLEREISLRDGSPEHTLDWYTYNNKVSLLEEVRALIKEEKSKPVAKRVVDKTKDAEVEVVTEK